MTVTLNGQHVLSGVLEMPRVGAWTADVDVDTSDAATVTGQATLALEGGLTLVGTTMVVGQFYGRTGVRVVGGAGGFGKLAPAQDYWHAPARIPLADALAAGGEALSASSDASVLSAMLPSWTRPMGTVGEALAMLALHLGVPWRVLPDGTVWLGTETWPLTAATKVLILDDDAKTSQLKVAADAPNILPGTVVAGVNVGRVIVRIAPDDISTTIVVENATPSLIGDRVLDALVRLVNRAMARVDFFALYPSKVVTQNGDGTVDVMPDNPRMPAKARVCIRLGLPGAAVKVASGARVLLGFDGGDPSLPYVAIWDFGGMTEIAFGGGSQGVARQGDVVALSIPPGTAFNGVAGPPVNTFVGTFTMPVRVTGTILTGSSVVKA